MEATKKTESKAKAKNAGATMVEVYTEKAELAKTAKANNKPAPRISVVEKIKVEFTKDDGKVKKGHTQIISALAFEIYNKRGSVKKVD